MNDTKESEENVADVVVVPEIQISSPARDPSLDPTANSPDKNSINSSQDLKLAYRPASTAPSCDQDLNSKPGELELEVSSLSARTTNVVAPLYFPPPPPTQETETQLYFPPTPPSSSSPWAKMETKLKLKIGGFFFIFVTVLTAVLLSASLHVIDEGHVGIYFKQGALVDEYGMPGMNTKAPFLTKVYQVTVRPTTDTLDPISAVTKDGIQNYFNEVTVISYVPQNKVIALVRRYGMEFKKALIFDRISEELRKFCATHNISEVYNEKFLDIVPYVVNETVNAIARLSNGSVEIINLVVPKPEIPLDIAENYKQVKVQWTEQLVATQQQETEKIRKETERMKALADANRTKDVLEIELQKELLQKEAEKNMSEIQNEITKLAEENLANVNAYKKEKEAEANKLLYSQEYIALELSKSLSQNTKFYFSGESSPLGALMDKILGPNTLQ